MKKKYGMVGFAISKLQIKLILQARQKAILNILMIFFTSFFSVRPGPPSIPIVCERRPQHVILQWDPSENTGNAESITYNVEFAPISKYGRCDILK